MPIPHVGHLSHLITAVCPHWRQLDPAQGHWKYKLEPVLKPTVQACLSTHRGQASIHESRKPDGSVFPLHNKVQKQSSKQDRAVPDPE